MNTGNFDKQNITYITFARSINLHFLKSSIVASQLISQALNISLRT
jgi:hypothetical protein